jgi:hypothetical protein
MFSWAFSFLAFKAIFPARAASIGLKQGLEVAEAEREDIVVVVLVWFGSEDGDGDELSVAIICYSLVLA